MTTRASSILHRIGHVLRVVLASVGVLLTFVLSLVAGLLLHLNLPAARRFAMAELNSILDPQFKGKIKVTRLASLSIFGVKGVDAQVDAADGTRVITGRGVGARISPLTIIKSALFGKGDLRIGVDVLTIDAVDACLDSTADGNLKLVGAFDPAKPSTPSPPGARGTAIDLSDIRLQHAWVHGAITGAPAIDADVDALRAAFLSATNVTKLDVPQLTLTARALPMGIDVHSSVQAHLAMPAPSGASMLAYGSLDGTVGKIPLTVNGKMDGDAVDAVLDVPEVSPEDVQASVEGAPVYKTVAAHAEAHGDLANLATRLHARLGDGAVDLDGTVHAKGALGGDVKVVARHIDARTFSKTAPATDVGATIVAVASTKADKSMVGHVSVDIPVGTAAGQSVPHTTLQIEGTQRVDKEGEASTIRGHLEGIVDEPGAPLALTADARSRDGVTDASFGAKTDVEHLDRVKRVGNLGTGKLDLTLTGHAHVAKTVTVEAEVAAVGDGIDSNGAHVDHVVIAAKASGEAADPTVDARVVADGVKAAGYAFTRAEVEVAGKPSGARVAVAATGKVWALAKPPVVPAAVASVDPKQAGATPPADLGTPASKSVARVVDAIKRAPADAPPPKITPNITLETDVAVTPAIAVRNTKLALSRGTDALKVGVDSVRVGGGAIDARGVTVTGAGEPLVAEFHSSPGAIRVKAETKGLDLGKVAYLAGQDRTLGGNVALAVDVDARREGAKGKVSVDLTKGTAPNVTNGEAHLNVELDGRHLTGKLHAGIGDAGALDLHDLDLHIGGNDALDARSWRHAWGKVGITANVDLARAATIYAPSSMNLTDVGGRAVLEGEIARDSLSDLTPEIHLSLMTDGLRATGESTAPIREAGGPLMVGPATWRLYGMDLRANLDIDGADSAGELAVRIVEPKGPLLSLDVKTDPLPFATVFGGGGDLTGELEALPISVLVDVPEHEVSKLPLLVRPDGVKGNASVLLTMKGTAREPVVDLAVKGLGLVASAAPDIPMDGEVNAHYEGDAAHVGAEVRSKNAKLLDADVDLKARVADFLVAAKPAAPPAWSGSAKAVLTRFPLAAISMLSEDQVKGFVSGQVAVTGLHEHGQADVKLALEDLKMGKAKFTKGNVEATLDDKGLNGKVRLEETDGFLEADATMGMKWGQDLVPTPDDTGLKAKLSAKHFPAAAAAPFASSAVSELSGWIDADANVALVPQQKPKMSGTVTFSDGVVQAPAIGEEFHAMKAKVTLSEDGSIKLDELEGRGLAGRFTATGSAKLDGTALTNADLTLDIKKKEAIPLDIQGTNLGSVYGDVTVKATGTPDGKSLKVAVNVPHFNVDLPEAGFPKSPQGLADAPGVHVGVYRDPDRFIVLPLDDAPVKLVAERNATVAALPRSGGVPKPPSPPSGQAEAAKADATGKALAVDVKLGEIVVTRGQQVSITLDGALTAEIAEATKVRGQVHLKSGKLEVQSKEFEIEKGVISFVGDDPSNPEINVTAGWTAPDGTRVLAEYIGPVKTGKVNLRSEPPRPKNEIVSLILFGTADGSSATPYASQSPSTGVQAGTTAGGLATDGLSKGLDQLTGMNIQTKIDTSDSSNPRPEVEVQIAKDISLELSFVIVTPSPGMNPDMAYATVDWRFVRNWSLATTFGDEGSTFADIIWQYRY